MRTHVAVLAALIAAGSALAAPLASQQRLAYRAGVTATGVTARSALPADPQQRVSGLALGVEGDLAWNRLALHLGYLRGSLRPHGAAEARDQVEGYALVGVSPLPGVEILTGPHARAYVVDGLTERWLFWGLRARYEAPILDPAVGGYAELWGALGGSVSVAEPFNSARGGSAGLRFRLAAGRVAVRLGYMIDEARLGAGTRRETVEGITVAVGFGR